MRVKCVKIINPSTGLVAQENDYLTIGSEYEVLCVHFREIYSADVDARLRGLYRIETNAEISPGLFDIRQFDTVSEKIPEYWIIEMQNNGSMYLGAKEWRTIGFWEEYFNNDVNALKIFRDVRDKILSNT